MRELSKNLAVNPNAVARAYRELRNDNVLETIRGTGLQVTKTAPKKCRADRVGLIRERLRSVLVEAKHSQLTIDEIRVDGRSVAGEIDLTRGASTACRRTGRT